MKISTKIGIFFLLMVSLLLGMTFTLTKLLEKSERIGAFQEQRFEFYELVKNYEKSNNRFTELFLIYFATNDQVYKEKFEASLSGACLDEATLQACQYGVLKAFDFDLPPALGVNQRQAIATFFEEIGLSEQKFQDIFKADQLAKAFLKIEIEALNASQGLFKDSKNRYTLQKPKDINYAKSLLASQEYQSLNSEFYQNLELLFNEIDFYLNQYLYELRAQEKRLNTLLTLVSVGLIILTILFYFGFRTLIVEPLNMLSHWIDKLQNNEFESKEAVFKKDELGRIMQAFYKMATQINAYIKELQYLSTTDRLTKLKNRLTLDKEIEKIFYSVLRYKINASIILTDIDHFKQVNDSYGHLIGDEVLVDFAKILQNNVRESDIVGRWGGEEFLIICPNTDLQGAVALANKLRELIADHHFKQVGHKTASFGIASFKTTSTIEMVLDEADQALYQAKNAGRNQVVTL